MKIDNEGMKSKKFVLQNGEVKALNTHGPNPCLREVNWIPPPMGITSTDADQQMDSNLSFRSLLVMSVSYSNEMKMSISMTQ